MNQIDFTLNLVNVILDKVTEFSQKVHQSLDVSKFPLELVSIFNYLKGVASRHNKEAVAWNLEDSKK